MSDTPDVQPLFICRSCAHEWNDPDRPHCAACGSPYRIHNPELDKEKEFEAKWTAHRLRVILDSMLSKGDCHCQRHPWFAELLRNYRRPLDRRAAEFLRHSVRDFQIGDLLLFTPRRTSGDSDQTPRVYQEFLRYEIARLESRAGETPDVSPALAEAFPLPWEVDISPQETPAGRRQATIYARDSSLVCHLHGQHSHELARLIAGTINRAVKSPDSLEAPSTAGESGK